MLAFAESQTQVTRTFVVATLLHTRAPMGNRLGPAAGLLLSSPMTFQVIGVTVSEGESAFAMGVEMNQLAIAAPSAISERNRIVPWE
jgi:hypothetical protein